MEVTIQGHNYFIAEIAKRTPTTSHSELQSQFPQATDVSVSVETVRKRLRTPELFNKK